MARELNLATVLGSSGVSWTRGEMLLAYNQLQYLDVVLEKDARLVEVKVDGVTLHAIKRGDAPGHWSIPLPPKSHAAIVFLYARPYVRRADRTSSLDDGGLSAL